MDGEVALSWGEFLAKGVEGGDEELDDLVGGVEVGWTLLIVLGILAFEEPTGGAPVAVGFCGIADGAQELNFEVGFGLGELASERGVASCGAGDGAGGTADVAGCDASTTADGEEGEDALAFFLIECGRTTWGLHGYT